MARARHGLLRIATLLATLGLPGCLTHALWSARGHELLPALEREGSRVQRVRADLRPESPALAVELDLRTLSPSWKQELGIAPDASRVALQLACESAPVLWMLADGEALGLEDATLVFVRGDTEPDADPRQPWLAVRGRIPLAEVVRWQTDAEAATAPESRPRPGSRPSESAAELRDRFARLPWLHWLDASRPRSLRGELEDLSATQAEVGPALARAHDADARQMLRGLWLNGADRNERVAGGPRFVARADLLCYERWIEADVRDAELCWRAHARCELAKHADGACGTEVTGALEVTFVTATARGTSGMSKLAKVLLTPLTATVDAASLGLIGLAWLWLTDEWDDPDEAKPCEDPRERWTWASADRNRGKPLQGKK